MIVLLRRLMFIKNASGVEKVLTDSMSKDTLRALLSTPHQATAVDSQFCSVIQKSSKTPANLLRCGTEHYKTSKRP